MCNFQLYHHYICLPDKPGGFSWKGIMAAARFTVTKAVDEEEQPITDTSGGYGSVPHTTHLQQMGELLPFS